MDAYSETHLIQGLRDGNEKAFKTIFDLHYRPLTLFALKYVVEVEEAKEIVQDLFVRLWVRHGELQIQFSLKNYLYQGVKHACLNYLESNKVLQRRMQYYKPPTITEVNALEHLVAAEQEELLIKAIDALPLKCREIFLLSRTNKLPNQAIATQLNISIKTVEAQITIALKRLLQSLITSLMFLFF